MSLSLRSSGPSARAGCGFCRLEEMRNGSVTRSRLELLAAVLPESHMRPGDARTQERVLPARSLHHADPRSSDPEVSLPRLSPHHVFPDIRRDLPAQDAGAGGRHHPRDPARLIPATSGGCPRNQSQDRVAAARPRQTSGHSMGGPGLRAIGWAAARLSGGCGRYATPGYGSVSAPSICEMS